LVERFLIPAGQHLTLNGLAALEVGAGHYEEEYRRVSDEWKIAYMRFTRTRCDALVGPAAPQIGGYPSSRDSDFMP